MALHEESVRLRHMLDFAQQAVEFTRDACRSDLDTNPVLALAIIHLVEMSGEAARGVSAELRSRHPEVPWRQYGSV